MPEPRQSSAEVSRQKKLAVRRLMFVITEGQYVLSHRVGLAMAARDAGWEVTIVTETREHGQRIRALGFEVIDFTFSKRRFSLWTNFTAILKLYHIYRCYRPHLVHHVSLQPSLLGSIAAAFARVPAVINGITGMGFTLTHNSLRARAIRSVLLPTLRWASRRDRTYTMTQNSDDTVLVMSFGIEHSRIVRMCDTGVNVERFVTAPEPPGPVRVTMVSRLIWDKGVHEFLEAASRVRAMRDDIVFTLVGVPDEGNPAQVPIEKITEGTAAGHVEWWGYQTDVNSVWSRSHIAALPSYYREGIPPILAGSLCLRTPHSDDGYTRMSRHSAARSRRPSGSPARCGGVRRRGHHTRRRSAPSRLHGPRQPKEGGGGVQ